MGRKINDRDREARQLATELLGYEKAGMKLYLNGQLSEPGEISRACLCAEHSNYMRDFISDETDRITEIHFIRISSERENTERRSGR